MIFIKSGENIATSLYSLPITNKPVMTRCLLSVAVASALLLSGCGDDNNDNNTGPVVSANPATVKTVSLVSASQINSPLFGLSNTATPVAKCDVKVEKVTYQTVGAAGERTMATAALMLPSGTTADCTGNRPILLYAHGTTTDKGYDFSQVGNAKNPAVGEANLIAANFAAQGYIVVAPNYAGYDESTLDYHPYLVADQQSADMVDALNGSRAVIKSQKQASNASYANVADSGKLFISGYSQGGHVAMATARLLESQNQPITAIAPLSGPYALAAFGDAIFTGNVNIGATRFAPLLAVGLQKKYPDVYSNPNEIFSNQYANTKLPSNLSFEQLVAAGQLPDNALFQSKPTGNALLDQLPNSKLPFAALGFAPSNFFIKTDFRAAFVADSLANPDSLIAMTGAFPAANPQNNLRKALKDNDLRGYVPSTPTLLCGGNQDPTVFFDINTSSMAGILNQVSKAPGANLNVTVLDVDKTNKATRPQPTVTVIGSAINNPWMTSTAIDDVQNKFAATVNATNTAAYTRAYAAAFTAARQAGQSETEANATAMAAGNQAAGFAFLSSYHGGFVSAACTQATREFFEQNFNRPAGATVKAS